MAYRSRDASALALLAPLQQGGGDDADEEDQACQQTSASGDAKRVVHSCEPERSQESPGGAYDVDKDANAGTVLNVAINGVGDEHCGDDLVADGSNGDADLH